MKKLSRIMYNAQKLMERHTPEILIGVGIAGMVTTTILAVRTTPKAIRLLEAKKEEKGESLTKTEVVKTCWKCYIPAVATGVFSTVCIIGANSVHARRNAALATAYKLTETAFTEYKDKTLETIGEKKENLIRDKIAKDHIDDNPVSKNEVIVMGKGDTLCYDSISGRYFKSDIDKIRKAENYVNKRMMSEMYISLNEFYSEIGLSCTKMGNDLGWNMDMDTLEIYFSTQLSDDETPCLVLDYSVAPKYDYQRLS